MPYRLKVTRAEIMRHGGYVNAKGDAECVEFVRQTTGAPNTAAWRRGLRIKDAKPGEIVSGTAIATFDETGHFPRPKSGHGGRHSAIYLRHDGQQIYVLDQWPDKGRVTERPIRFGTKKRISDNGDYFYVIE